MNKAHNQKTKKMAKHVQIVSILFIASTIITCVTLSVAMVFLIASVMM